MLSSPFPTADIVHGAVRRSKSGKQQRITLTRQERWNDFQHADKRYEEASGDTLNPVSWLRYLWRCHDHLSAAPRNRKFPFHSGPFRERARSGHAPPQV